MLQGLFRSWKSRRQAAPSTSDSDPAPSGARMALWASMAQSRQDRSRSPVRSGVNAGGPSSSRSAAVRAATDLPGMSSVQDIFCLPSHMVSRMSGELGKERVLQALGRLQSSSLTTMFSGCGLCEIWVEALASHAGVKVNLGSALDWEPTAQSVLCSRWPKRCIFGNVMDQVKGLKKGKKKPTCKALASTCFCFTHQKQCSTALQFVPFGDGLELLALLAKVRKRPPDVLIFENVDRYPGDLLADALSDLFDMLPAKLNPPDVFSVPMARPRQYWILWNKSTCVWVGPEISESWLEAMQAVVIPKGTMDANIFTSDPDESSIRKMTDSERKHYRQYLQLLKEQKEKEKKLKKKKHPITAVDLRQSNARPVTSLADGSLPTLRTTSGSIYMLEKKEFLSDQQLLRAQGWPIHPADSRRLGLDHAPWPSDLKRSAGIQMAGNAMFAAFPALAVFTALLYIEKRQ
eukprot:s1331_g25.t1